MVITKNLKKSNQCDRFLYEIQKQKMWELWDNKEDKELIKKLKDFK